jgi:parvulin-like peptidyl-prolyl isomerase
MTLQAYRDQTRKQLIFQKYITTKKGDLINSIKMPTEQEIQAEYVLRRSELLRPEIVNVSAIFIAYGPDTSSRSKARDLANKLIKEIGSNPSKFDEVLALSRSPNSGYQSDTGYLFRNQETRGRVGEKLMDAAFSLKQGQVSQLIEGLEGFQIIKVTENYAEKILELYDFVQPGSKATVRDLIGQDLFNKRQQNILMQASQELFNELRKGRDFKIQNNLLNW